MVRAVTRWLASSVVLLFAVTALTFVLTALAPGDAAKTILSGADTSYTPAQYHHLRRQLGLDESLPVQYWHWLNHLLHGSLGTDLFNGQPVTQALASRIGPSLSIIVGAVIMSTLIGLAVGILSAVRRGWLSRTVDFVSMLGLAAPNFWLALVLAEIAAVELRLFPTTGYVTLGSDPVQWLRSIALPVFALSFAPAAVIARQTRSAMGEVLTSSYITALRARGLPTRSIVFKHALRNAAIPVVTLIGLLFVGLLGGTVFVESIFSIPGLGQQAVTASTTHDLPMIEGVAFYFTVVVVVVNLLVDVGYRLLNPNVRLS